MSEEKVLGGLEVEASLRLGSERLLLLFTQERLILAHVAKIGRATLALSSLLGRVAASLEKGQGRGELGKIASLTPDEILRHDPDNFAVNYGAVVGLTMELAPVGRSRIFLVTSDMKVELAASPVAIEGLRDLVMSLLGEKVVFRARGS